MWRLCDMICFGKFEDEWGFKTDLDVSTHFSDLKFRFFTESCNEAKSGLSMNIHFQQPLIFYSCHF